MKKYGYIYKSAETCPRAIESAIFSLNALQNDAVSYVLEDSHVIHLGAICGALLIVSSQHTPEATVLPGDPVPQIKRYIGSSEPTENAP